MTARRVDPLRRDRIIDAALDVIAEEGVAGASHRRIARQADVPLGSMTYHFENMDEVLREAFTRFLSSVATRFQTRLSNASNIAEARTAVVDLIHIDLAESQRNLVLTHELYTLAARKPVYRELTREWMRQSREALERHFPPDVARQLDALIEGLTIHRALEITPHSRELTMGAVFKITGGAPSLGKESVQ